MEGYTADVTNLRRALAAVDRKLHEMRLVERLGDDERLDAILAHLRHRAPNVPLPAPPPRMGGGQRLQQQRGRDQGDGGSELDGGASDDGSLRSGSAKAELEAELEVIRRHLTGLEAQVIMMTQRRFPLAASRCCAHLLPTAAGWSHLPAT